MTLDHESLERELRAARTAYDQVTFSPDAWQENQRRLSRRARDAAHVGRTVRWLTVAAAVVAFALVGYSLSQTGGVGRDAPPANEDSSSGDMFEPENLLGPVVTLETVDVDGVPSVHEVALVDPTGDGPQLCDSFTSDGFAAAGARHAGQRRTSRTSSSTGSVARPTTAPSAASSSASRTGSTTSRCG